MEDAQGILFDSRNFSTFCQATRGFIDFWFRPRLLRFLDEPTLAGFWCTWFKRIHSACADGDCVQTAIFLSHRDAAAAGYFGGIVCSVAAAATPAQIHDDHVDGLLRYLQHVPHLHGLYRTSQLFYSNMPKLLGVFIQLRFTAHLLERLESRIDLGDVKNDLLAVDLGAAWNELGDAEACLTRLLELTYAMMPGWFDHHRWAMIRPRPPQLEQEIAYFCPDFTLRFQPFKFEQLQAEPPMQG